MSALDMEATPSMMSWPDICQQYPNEWVFLLDAEGEEELNGMPRAGRLVAHHRSVSRVLDCVGLPQPANATIVHTSGPIILPFRWVEVLGDPIQHESVEIVLEDE